MKVVVSAVPGSGKSTVMEIVKRRLRGLKVVNVGDMMFEIAVKELGITQRDQMRKKLKVYQQRDFQAIVARKIARMKARDIIIDTHSAVKTPHGYFPGLSDTPVKIVNPDAFVILEYDPKEVIKRRDADKSRKRDKEDEKTIEDHQSANKYFAFGAAQHADASVKVVNLRFRQRSKFQHAQIAADEIVKLFKFQHRL